MHMYTNHKYITICTGRDQLILTEGVKLTVFSLMMKQKKSAFTCDCDHNSYRTVTCVIIRHYDLTTFILVRHIV